MSWPGPAAASAISRIVAGRQMACSLTKSWPSWIFQSAKDETVSGECALFAGLDLDQEVIQPHQPVLLGRAESLAVQLAWDDELESFGAHLGCLVLGNRRLEREQVFVRDPVCLV